MNHNLKPSAKGGSAYGGKTHNLHAGFTLLEVMLALGIGAASATLLTVVVTAGLRNIREMRRTERLHASAQHVTDTLAYWVRQAAYARLDDPNTLRIYMPTATSFAPMVLQKNGARLTREGVDLLPAHVMLQSFSWQVMPRSVRYAFTLKETGGGNAFSVTTTVALRNNFP